MQPAKMHPERNRKTRILIADDHPIVRYGLSQLINQQPDMCVSAAASGMTEALQAIESGKVDFVIAGVTLGDGSGIDLIKHVKSQFDKLPMLVFSMHDESLFAERVLRAGAFGYLMKSEPVEKILAAIRRVLDGNVCVSEPIIKQLLKNQRAAPANDLHASLQTLTDRELEVYNHIGRGKSTRDIAGLLHINIKTVETHCTHIIKKLDLKSMLELIHYASSWFHHTGR